MSVIFPMSKLLFAMIIGFLLFKRGTMTQDGNRKMSDLIVNVTCPCIVLSSVANVPHDNPQIVLKLFATGIAAYLLFPCLAWCFARLFRVPAQLRGTYMCMLIFSNCIFIGYPIVQSLYGDSAIFYITIFNMPFNILFFAIALDLFRKDAMIDAADRRRERISFKKFLHPGILSSVVALVIYFAQIPLPALFFDCVGFVGSITTPLSMVIIGASLAAVSLKELRHETAIWAMLPIRLVIMPLLVWGFMHLVTDDPALIGICTVGAGMPVASLVGMASAPYERQNRCASIGIAASSIASLITVPIMALLLKAG